MGISAGFSPCSSHRSPRVVPSPWRPDSIHSHYPLHLTLIPILFYADLMTESAPEFAFKNAGLPLAPVTTEDEAYYELAYRVEDEASRQLHLINHRRIKEHESIINTFEKVFRVLRWGIPAGLSVGGFIVALVT